MDDLKEMDDYELCGQIFRTPKGVMIFYCTICETKFEGFDKYEIHFEEKHTQKTLFDFNTISQDFCIQESSEMSLNNANVEKIDNVSAINSQPRMRPLRKKTNYFPDKNEVRPLQCPVCDAKFKDPSSFSKHKFRHQTEKIHPCPECTKMFYTPMDVKRHQVSHTGLRPFLCNVCGKTLISSVKLNIHMRRHMNIRDYECSECKKRFYDSNLLANHKLVHSKERRFSCDLCDAKFTFRKGLKNHQRLHENKREYKCELCGLGFNQLAGLFCHKKTKHKIL